MEYRAFGKTDMKVSVLGFGGAEIGYQEIEPSIVERLLGSALDAGLNVIDTAACYNISEELIGKTMSHRRKDYYLFSKCGHASGLETPDWDVRTIRDSIDRSLKRLKTDYLDLVQLHSCSLETLKAGEVIEVLERAKEAGKVRYIGYSGDNEAAEYAVQTSVFDSLQTSVNIADQSPLNKILPEAAARGMGVIAKRPIANVAWLSDVEPPSEYARPYWERLRELKYTCLEGNTREAVGTALRFTLSCPAVCTAIVGTTNPSRWQENAELLEAGMLSDSEFETIRTRWQDVANEDWVGKT